MAKKVHTQRIERGSGKCVQAEIPRMLYEQLRLEMLRRERQGQPATVEAVVYEAIVHYAINWPTPPDDYESSMN